MFHGTADPTWSALATVRPLSDAIGDGIADSQLPSHTNEEVRMEEDALPREDVDFATFTAITGTERTGSTQLGFFRISRCSSEWQWWTQLLEWKVHLCDFHQNSITNNTKIFVFSNYIVYFDCRSALVEVCHYLLNCIQQGLRHCLVDTVVAIGGTNE